MIFIIILIAVAFLFALLLFLPLGLFIKYEENNLQIYIKYIFFKFNLLPAEEEEPAKAKFEEIPQQKIKEKKENIFVKFFKKYKVKGSIDITKKVWKIISVAIKKIYRHMKFKKINLYIGIVGEDAANTANIASIISVLLYPLMGIIVSRARGIKEYNFRIEPLFTEKEMKTYVDVKVRISPVFLILPMLKLLFKGLLLINNIRSKINKKEEFNKIDKNKANVNMNA